MLDSKLEILVVCSWCAPGVRNARIGGVWLFNRELQAEIAKREKQGMTGMISHSICPDCKEDVDAELRGCLHVNPTEC